MTEAEKGLESFELYPLEEALGYCFRDKRILELALTHSSYRNEQEGVADDNERFEFLGDAVLDLVVAQWLFQKLPTAKEGELTKRKAALVCEPSLARLAEGFGLGAHLRLGRGEEMTGGRGKQSLLANSVEAVVAAVFLDGGFERATSLVLGWLSEAEVPATGLGDAYESPRSALQNLVQARHGILPEYQIEEMPGAGEAEGFVARALVPGESSVTGSGRSKKEAIREAAARMLDQINESAQS